MNSINYKSYPIQLFLAGIPKPLTDYHPRKITDAESAQFFASSTVLPNARKAVTSGLLLSGYNYLSHIVSYGRDDNPV
uniref:DUF4248 domain-containing protein n=1 Tax=Heterorhabditis bacteriophora TaxID=37862 RepID=A0A1I7XNZ7_HETBA